ncbi:hypothetical protein GCM10025879_00740 [Leuconostoc litchii]|uniref:Uncharacterized protein n=1 Tax=Leuconostoc litchii TaxID=1981069 RepID=A0A6P2CLQ0_9LACO|nr:hypothetical protein [Leuconostoc litchii]TYC46925.1 hypothetical protein ESZ47_01925 [Leuconostoc litchii]GMA68828.1 hypothetical protein GCM10025879_00740 [Leuconostoc litchii]
MKVPVYSPIEQLRESVTKLQNKALLSIANFRTNVLKNRDNRSHQIAKPAKTREISIVPYEATPKAVDMDSFAYALEAAITESDAPKKSHFSISNHIKNFFYHPLRILVAVIILILLTYIAIMFSKAISTNQTPITETHVHHSQKTQ